MATDENFVGAGKAVGMELWRIEKMVPVKQDKVDGKFHTGDSYILLATTKARHGNALEWNIHFWLGEETSQDESGVAAYKSVELDESLGGAPVQHREVQGAESNLFMSYFKSTGLEYLPGGVDSGFTHVERDVFRTRLLHCKGKRSVRCSEKPCEIASLNNGDVFILDKGLELFLFNGKTANRYEKAKGAEMLQKINNERGARCTVTFLDEDPHNATFWEALGGEAEITNEGEDDDVAERKSANATKLFRISADSGDLQVDEVPRNAKGQLTRDMLDTGDAYILDAESEVYVWVGKQASATERKESMVLAQKFVVDQGRPNSTRISRVVESGESSIFKSFFFQFDPPMVPKSNFGAQSTQGVAAAVEERPVDFAGLHASQEANDTPVDDGSGKLTIWRVEDFKKVEVDPSKHGQFFGGDSYVLLYSYMQGSREEHIVYFWQGRESSKDEIGASALLAKETDDELGGIATQVRVVQGKEPTHFRQLFKGKMIVHEGGKASGFKNSTEEDSYDDDGVGLFHVKGTNSMNTFATQVAEKASSLNSMDCFVLVTPSCVYSWRGKGANDSEKASADGIASILHTHTYGPPGSEPPAREMQVVDEGEEPEAFWGSVGGKGEYASVPEGEPLPSEPRLFHCTNAYGRFQVEEITNFTQEDLLEDDVMLLDVGTAVYAWIGNGSNREERTKAFETAIEYNRTAPDGRDADTAVICLNSGNEPVLFTQFFPGWDPSLSEKNKFVDPYEAKMQAMKAEQAKRNAEQAADEPPAPPVPVGNAALAPSDGFLDTSTKFDYEQLKNGIPEGVDPTKKEMYLSDSQFSELFGQDAAAFSAMPAWKKQAAKKKVGLF